MIPFYSYQPAVPVLQAQTSLLGPFVLSHPVFQVYYSQASPVFSSFEGFESSTKMVGINFLSTEPKDNSYNPFQEGPTKAPGTPRPQQNLSGIMNRQQAVSGGKKQKYYKKNTESNISNQVLSFLSCPVKSEPVLVEICGKLNLCHVKLSPRFYCYMGIIRRQKRKYSNKKMLLALCCETEENPLCKLLDQSDQERFEADLATYCKLIRILIKIFMDEYCPLTVLTSKKIDKQGVLDHLKRRRQIRSFLLKEI